MKYRPPLPLGVEAIEKRVFGAPSIKVVSCTFIALVTKSLLKKNDSFVLTCSSLNYNFFSLNLEVSVIVGLIEKN